MYAFSVNGKQIQTGQDKKLLRFLRDDLKLVGTKDGCSEGACGTCTVIINGKATKACVPSLSKLEGASVITIEGLTAREQEVYVHCFAEAGAVQCGYCTPGMIMAAKALLDQTPDPTPEDVKKALRGNICRCTGYVKIEQAVMMAAKFFREQTPVPTLEELPLLSHRFKRIDVQEKVLGTGQFVDDMDETGIAHAKAVRSAYPRAKVLAIDTTAALAHPDCITVLTAADVPQDMIGHLVQDWDVMIPVGHVTHYIGDAVALVVSRRKESLDEIAALVQVSYEVLEPVVSPAQAMADGAPLLHETGNILSEEHILRGDAASALASSAHVVTCHFSTPFTEHAFMEPECALAYPTEDGGVSVYTGGQSVYDEQHEIARMLKLPLELVRCRSKLVGGGFGGKEDMSVQHHAALAAWVTKLPVKVRLSRQESINVHPKRHPMEMDFTVGCDADGKLTGMQAVLIADTGAYASLGGPVLQRACTHAAGPYNYQNIDILGRAVYTNNVPAGAFRGFGVTQSCFAMECTLNLLAEKAGIDPWVIRRINAIAPGQTLPNGQIATPDTGIIECLEAVKEAYYASPRSGIACAMKNSGIGVGCPDVGRCILSIEDGIVHVRTSAACMGQGVATMCVQMVGQTTGLSADKIMVELPDTQRTPDSGTSTASRQTAFTGEAVRKASHDLRIALDAMDGDLGKLDGQEYMAEFMVMTDPISSKKEHPVSHLAYSYSAQVVHLDETGKVSDVVAACDVGTVVNIQSVEGQIEGGVIMGLGYALTEKFPIEGGYPKVKYGTLGLLRSTDAPPISVLLVTGPHVGHTAYGAKGVGELCTIPTAPACQHAYQRFDGKFRTSLPMDGTAYRK